MPRHFLLVTEVPPGEAPQWVREKWVGLKLPLAQRSSRPIRRMTAGVITGPRTVFAALRALLTGNWSRSEGYWVDARAALAVLESAHPDAASWWRIHTPHMFRGKRRFMFQAGVGRIVE